MFRPWKRDHELENLHPAVRDKVKALLEILSSNGVPFRLFEGYRSPQRQQYLYEQGRSRPGRIVTKAKPWTSYHQYGLAGDFVLYENGKWSWDTSGKKAKWWEQLHAFGKECGLHPLSWEKPHLQLSGLNIREVRNGNYPEGSDLEWAECMHEAISSWSGFPPSPPLPALIPERPSLNEGDSEPIDKDDEIPLPDTENWHGKFGGREWRFDDLGVYIREYAGGEKPMRTRGKPITCRAIWSLFSDEIITASKQYAIPPAIIIMTIATETSIYRKQGFTGPKTFRWESHVWVKDVSPPIQGDYSAGPMQTLATTARWVIREQDLEHAPFEVAPALRRPSELPRNLPLYDPEINIDIGSAEIKQRIGTTGYDPILVAAAYNAGGLYENHENPWHLRTYGDHLDRAAKWYGDACAVLKDVGII